MVSRGVNLRSQVSPEPSPYVPETTWNAYTSSIPSMGKLACSVCGCVSITRSGHNLYCHFCQKRWRAKVE